MSATTSGTTNAIIDGTSHARRGRRVAMAALSLLAVGSLLPIGGAAGTVHALHVQGDDDVATGPPPTPPPTDNYVTTTTAAQRSLDVSAISPTCIRNVPYISYTIVPQGFTSTGPATLTFSDVDGNFVNQVVVPTLSGQIIYPGAVAGPGGDGVDWPGWKLADDGISWIVDPSDAILREGVTITVEVGSTTATTTIDYVASGSGCANPPEATPPTTDPRCVPGQNNDATPADDCSLASTGGGPGNTLVIGALAVLAGLLTLATSRRRRPDLTPEER